MKNRKIIIIGPVWPYRGGIAHHTALLADSLSKDNEVKVVSYKMQYPGFLYKGKQKEAGSDLFRYGNSTYDIHTLNPFNWISAARRIKKEKPDLIIVQWWHIYFAPVYQGILRALPGNIPVIFICHNIYPHESKVPLKRILTRTTLNAGDGMIVHADAEAELLKELMPAARYRKTVLPITNTFKVRNISQKDARDMLGVKEDAHVLLFFGFIRKYKGLKYLIEAMPKITEAYPDTVLFIVGDFFENDKEQYVELINESGCGSSIRLVDGYLPDEAVEPYFAACDALVLPYVSSTQSGIVQIAYGFSKPVLASAVGGLPDVIKDGKTGYLFEPENPEAIAESVDRFFRDPDRDAFMREIEAQNDLNSWDHMNDVIGELYEEITIGKEGKKKPHKTGR